MERNVHYENRPCLRHGVLGQYLRFAFADDIVGLLCLGVGTLFVVPYHDMARTNFFMALQAEQDDEIEALRDGGGYPEETKNAESGENGEVLR